MSYEYYKIFKPYGTLSQFTPEAGHPALGALFPFPKDVYPVGRIDHDSEGLLLLTNDPRINGRVLDPKFKHSKTYWAQIEGVMNEETLKQLSGGVIINLKGTLHKTMPSKIRKLSKPDFIPERKPPVNYIKHPVTSWIEIVLSEGKNRQVRKMTAKVGHPTLRLIRYAMEEVTINGMQNGDVIKMSADEFYKGLKIVR